MTGWKAQGTYRRRRRATIAAAIGCAGLLALAGAAQGASWLLPATDVSSLQAPVGCGFLCLAPGAAGVDVAVDSNGNAVAGWARRDDANNMIVQTSFRPAGGSFGPPQSLGVTQAYFLGVFGPLIDVAIDDQGNAIVVWPTTRNQRTVVVASTRPPGGAFGTAFDLSDDTQTAGGDPRVAMSRSGHTVVTWSRSNATHTIVQAASRPPGGSFAPTPANLSAALQNATNPRVALNEAGAAVVTWSRSNGANTIVQARVRQAGSGAFEAVQDLSAAGQNASSPDAAIDPAGRSTVVWQRPDGLGDDRVQSRFLNAAGVVQAGTDDLSDTGRDGSAAQVALDAENTAVAVWTDCAANGANCLVQSAARPSNGSFGSVQSISSPGDGNFSPRVVIDAQGTAVAAWSQFGTPVFVQATRRPKGGAFGGVDNLSATGTAFSPSLAVDAHGNTIAGWAFTRPAPDGRQVAQVAVFDAEAPTFTSIVAPATVTRGVAAGMSAAATDRYSGASLSWSFGDGAGAAGGSVAHAYGAAGVYTVTVVASDAAGNSAATTRTVQVVDPITQPTPAARRIRSTVSTSWSVLGSRTTIVRLLAPAGPGPRARAGALSRQAVPVQAQERQAPPQRDRQHARGARLQEGAAVRADARGPDHSAWMDRQGRPLQDAQRQAAEEQHALPRDRYVKATAPMLNWTS